MAWTKITRRKLRRDGLRYASDLTDAEWALIDPLCRRLHASAARTRRSCGRS